MSTFYFLSAAAAAIDRHCSFSVRRGLLDFPICSFNEGQWWRRSVGRSWCGSGRRRCAGCRSIGEGGFDFLKRFALLHHGGNLVSPFGGRGELPLKIRLSGEIAVSRDVGVRIQRDHAF